MTVSKKYNDNLVAGGAVRDGNGNRINTTYANVDLSNLSTTGNDKIKDVFIAEYGVTTYQEVLNAYNTKKQIFCKRFVNDYNIYIAPLTYYSPNLGEFIFSAIEWTYFSLHCYTINSSSEWNNTSETIGSSTTPVFVNSGRIMSTGLSIENSRFDGQWVSSDLVLSTATAINIYTLDLETYLPDTTGNYEVMVAYTISAKSTSVSNTKIYSDIMPISPSYMRQKTSSTTHTIFNSCLISIPVQRYLYFQISNQATDSTNIEVVGYRRLGTNS